jgi:hypothetical protein
VPGAPDRVPGERDILRDWYVHEVRIIGYMLLKATEKFFLDCPGCGGWLRYGVIFKKEKLDSLG